MPFSAAVLAGGRSSRFGQDKATFFYREKPLLQWVLDSLQAADERFIVANRDYPGFGAHIYADIYSGGGSLSGLHTALVKARHEWLALTACDLPFLTREYWQYLLEHRTDAPVVVVSGEDGFEPLAALYHRSLLPRIEEQLSRYDYAMHKLIRQVDARVIQRELVLRQFGPDILRNINYPSDLPPDASQ